MPSVVAFALTALLGWTVQARSRLGPGLARQDGRGDEALHRDDPRDRTSSSRWCRSPAATFMMGSPEDEADRGEDEGPQHPVDHRPVLDGQARGDLGRVRRVRLQLRPQEARSARRSTSTPSPRTRRAADAVTRPTPPYADETFGLGREGQPVICITHHSAMEYCRWLSAKTGQHLPAADRGRVGIRLPGRHEDGLLLRRRPRRSRRLRLVLRELRGAAAGRHEEAEPLGPLRHARQRRRVVSSTTTSPDLYEQFAGDKPVVEPVVAARREGVSLRRPGRVVGRRRRRAAAAPRGAPRTATGASRTPSARRASGGTPTPPSSASGSSGRSRSRRTSRA